MALSIHQFILQILFILLEALGSVVHLQKIFVLVDIHLAIEGLWQHPLEDRSLVIKVGRGLMVVQLVVHVVGLLDG